MLKTRSNKAASAARTLLLGVSLVAVGVAQGPGPGPGTPPGLPPVMAPPQNPITASKAILGKILFWDEQLSSDNSMACGTCHRPGDAGGDSRFGIHPGLDGVMGTPDDKFGSPGVVRQDNGGSYAEDAIFGQRKQVTRRTSPNFFMGAWSPVLFWDGRATGTFTDPQTGMVSIPQGGALENQSVHPLVSDGEMAKEGVTWAEITGKLVTVEPLQLASNLPTDLNAALAGSPTYPQLFQAAFGSPAITAERIAYALATYERTLVPDQTPVDAIRGGAFPPSVLTMQQDQGRQIFFGAGRCDLCHGGPVGTNNQFVNVGLRPNNEDSGRMEVTGNPGDRGRFRVPSIRNAALKTRFMHNGQFSTLNQVVDFYARGGDFGNNQDNRIIPLNLNQNARNALVAFLQVGFTDPRVANETGPFARPTLWSELHPNGATQVGPAFPGTGGRFPQWISWTPPSVGNSEFKVGMRGGLGGAPAFLGIAPQGTAPGTFLAGTPLNVNHLHPSFILLNYLLEGAGPGSGYTTQKFDIPNDPSLVGYELFGQWWVADSGSTTGFAASAGARFPIF